MKLSGIYQIQSIIKPERIYIGSSIDITKRWKEHLRNLNKNKHHSIKLQNHYNKYTKEDFIFIVLEVCIPEFLIVREQYYINSLNPWFNICQVAGSILGIKRSPEYCKKHSINSKGNKNGFYGKHHSEESKRKKREYMLAHPVLKETRDKQRVSLLNYYKNKKK